jgi:hypothetical protein
MKAERVDVWKQMWPLFEVFSLCTASGKAKREKRRNCRRRRLERTVASYREG